jgi:preprotein translocase subunit SecD
MMSGMRAKRIALVAAWIFSSAAIVAPRAALANDAQTVDKMRAANAVTVAKMIEKQGGSRIQFKVDAPALREAIATELRDEAYQTVREGRIPFSGLAVRDGGVEIKIAEAKDRQRVVAKLAPATKAGPSADLNVTDAGDGLLRLAPTDAANAARLRDLVLQSVEMIEQRLRNIGIKQASVLPDGTDRIRVVLPAVTDPDRVLAVFNRKVRVSIRLVDVSMPAEDALRNGPPAGSEVLYGFKDKTPYLLSKESALDGDDIIDANPGFAPGTEKPVASFRFNARGTRRLAHITQENVGKPFAIVLDDKVLSAPIIREPITGGTGQISGDFTLEEANSIAMMLRAGALPGRLSVVEQQVVAATDGGGKP